MIPKGYSNAKKKLLKHNPYKDKIKFDIQTESHFHCMTIQL